jgi:putative ATP-binding cassette transporter
LKALVSALYRIDPRGAVLAALASMASGILAAAMAIILSRALANPGQGGALALAFFATAAGYFVLRILAETRLIRLTQTAALSLRVDLGHQILATPQRTLQQLGRQPVHTILTRDIDTFSGSVQLLPILLGNVFLIAGCFAYLAWLDWRICLAIFAARIVGASAFRRAERGPLIRLARLRDRVDALYVRQRALVDGTKELQLNAKRGTDFVNTVIAPEAAAVADDHVGALSSYIWVSNLGNSLFYLVIGLVLFGLSGSASAPLLPVVILLLYLIKPVSEVLICLPPLRQSAIALNRIAQLGDGLAHQAEVPLAAFDPTEITLQGVTHSYGRDSEDGTFTLGPIDLTLHRGEVVFLVGGNGSGKTTLAMLLTGLYTPETGTVLIDGQPLIDDTDRAAYRQCFAAVFSDFHLFEELPGSDDPAMEDRARHYIRLLRMDHKVDVHAGRLTTIALSTGQRKRLALVSAWLEDRPVYLFDEWAADQDPAFKAVFYNTLLPDLKARGKAVIVISHDDAYFHVADRIIKLVDGQIQPSGAP